MTRIEWLFLLLVMVVVAMGLFVLSDGLEKKDQMSYQAEDVRERVIVDDTGDAVVVQDAVVEDLSEISDDITELTEMI